MMILTLIFVYFVQITPDVLVHMPGEWPVLGSERNPVQLSVIAYVGKTYYIVSPSYLLNSHSSHLLCVDSTSCLNYSLAPND